MSNAYKFNLSRLYTGLRVDYRLCKLGVISQERLKIEDYY